MKKILVALAAAAALASCAKSEVEFTSEQQAIAITPVTENRTKAMVTGTEFPNEQFKVWAFYKQVNAGTSIEKWQASSAEQTKYIDEKPFAQKTTNKGLWGGANATYFWPKVGSLMFVGYYPVSLEDKVDYSFTSTENKMTVKEFTPGDYAQTGFVNTDATNCVEDFMYFNMTATSCDATTTGPDNSVKDGYHVDVVFRHALSWLTVVLKKGESTPEDATITVKDVYFTDIYTTGTGVVNNSPDADATPAETNEISWTTTDATTDVYVLGGADTDNTTELTTGYTCKQPVIIPQDMAGSLVIVYEIKSSDESAFTETKTIDLSDLNDGTADTWNPGKHYTYNVTISTTEILLDPVVVEWTDVPANVATGDTAAGN